MSPTKHLGLLPSARSPSTAPSSQDLQMFGCGGHAPRSRFGRRFTKYLSHWLACDKQQQRLSPSSPYLPHLSSSLSPRPFPFSFSLSPPPPPLHPCLELCRESNESRSQAKGLQCCLLIGGPPSGPTASGFLSRELGWCYFQTPQDTLLSSPSQTTYSTLLRANGSQPS